LSRAALVIVGGSTHPPEEKFLLESFRDLRRRWSGAKLILVPRHARRTAELVRLTQGFGQRVVRWSEPVPVEEPWAVLIVDTVGWLPALYSCAHIALVGGSLVPKGGHNFLEAAAADCAVVVGPHTKHFEELVDAYAAQEALCRLEDHGQLTPTLVRLAGRPAEREKLASNARRLLLSQQGVAEAYAQVIQNALFEYD